MTFFPSSPEHKKHLNFQLLPLNWISHLPPQVCASGPVPADIQTSGPLHKVDGIQHQRGAIWVGEVPGAFCAYPNTCMHGDFSHCCWSSLVACQKD